MLRIVLVPFFVWFLLLDAPGLQAQNGVWRWAAASSFAVAIYTDKLDGDIARSPRPRHRLRQDRRPDRRQAPDRLRAGHALAAAGTALVGHHPDPGPGMGHHRAALLRHPLRRDPGLARRKAQDRGPDRGHLPLHPSAGLDRAVARRRGLRRHDGRPGHHRLDRRRIRHRGPQAARQPASGPSNRSSRESKP